MDKGTEGSKKMMRKTVQKRAVLQVLKESKRHLTADEVYEIVKKRVPHISLGTVYRNLEMLAEMGQASRIDLGEGKRRFDSRTEPHHHFRCIRCGRIFDVPYFPLDDLESLSANTFRITGLQVVLEGICEECLRREEEKEGNDMASSEIDETQQRVMEALSRIGKPAGNKEIARTSGLDGKVVTKAIKALKTKGWVDSPVRCKYAVTESGKSEIK